MNKIVLSVAWMFLACSILPACSQKHKEIVTSRAELVSMDKNQLVNESDAIVEGMVVSQEVQKDFRGFPETDTTIKVTRVYKGNPGKEIEVRVDGGETKDRIYFSDEDMLPKFKKNESVVLFITANKGQRPDQNDFGYYVVGQFQGKFEIKNGKIINRTFSFDRDSFIKELQTIENENKINPPPRLFLDEGNESNI